MAGLCNRVGVIKLKVYMCLCAIYDTSLDKCKLNIYNGHGF